MKSLTTAAVSVAAALIASTTLLGATTAHAQNGPYYVATPVAAPSKSSVITRSTAWRVQGASLVAAQAPERPAILCQLLADRTGPLAGFSVAGKPVDAEALAKCNAKVAGRSVSVAAK
jgi:hypothetical protein